MSTYTAHLVWSRSGAAFTDRKYSRRHEWRFDGGAVVIGSSSPHVVPVPLSDPAGVDPEEAFVASLSSCHMLWFLAIAAKRGFVVDAYEDRAEGEMSAGADGKLFVSRVTLRPRTVFAADKRPSREEVGEMHHQAHEECFIARSVRSEVRCEPVWDDTTRG